MSLSPRLRSHRSLNSRVSRFCLAAYSSMVNFIGKFHEGLVPLSLATLVLAFCLWWFESPERETTTYTSILEKRFTSLRSLAETTFSSKVLYSMFRDLRFEREREREREIEFGGGAWQPLTSNLNYLCGEVVNDMRSDFCARG
ncbi:hypothetical protein SO802_027280 [Lithocarpus litseifolius]|uniref:Uncharacterized protein n=1 Tax=Lithocarpus litseifolius TaxID=425828 RepID=A0AAW2C7S1_9ROSI